jgi:hypothetical protein
MAPGNNFIILSKFKIVSDACGTDKTGAEIKQLLLFTVFEMAMDNEERHNRHTELEQANDTNNLADAFEAMADLGK